MVTPNPPFVVPANPPSPATPAKFDPSKVVMPACGTTALRGRPARQSSSFGKNGPGSAVNGDCRSNLANYPGACSSTLKNRDNPWWTTDMGKRVNWYAVSLRTVSECSQGCASSLAGARIMIGDQPWTSSASVNNFKLCGVVGSKVPAGARTVITCPFAIRGRYLAVFLPKKQTALTICEVDAIMG
ncbi:hypothetical protein H632_c236p0 [Helicosporidium sp. ATCC 50920]|nr:hypothetical protein H632_c236p0 [Helicosporidium sp. ATCC 50920]|eukprot:KDD76406.1 hypothetical protein H632_c236p0 [Helicosporidium sp. ATCC 50920]